VQWLLPVVGGRVMEEICEEISEAQQSRSFDREHVEQDNMEH
jgi:hypothetical protein